MYSQERRGRPGDENTNLVEKVVEGIKLSVCGKWNARSKGIEKCGGDALVDGIFRDIHEEEGQHVGQE